MTFLDLKKLAITGAIGIAFLMIGSTDTNAQSRREIQRERQRIARENARAEGDRYNDPRANRRLERRVDNANFTHGYQNGYMLGQNDRLRKKKYNHSNVYRDTPPYPTDGDPTNTDYLYRQGFLQGYNDGFYGRQNY